MILEPWPVTGQDHDVCCTWCGAPIDRDRYYFVVAGEIGTIICVSCGMESDYPIRVPTWPQAERN